MKQTKRRGRGQKNASKGLTRRGLRRIFYVGVAALGAILVVGLVVFFTRPKLLWYIDEDYSAAWNRIIKERAPPFLHSEVISRDTHGSFPKGRFGFVITRNGPEGERVEDAPVVLYRDLSRFREYNGWLVLALDPWMVFRKHQDPEPDRSFLDIGNERGSILLAGADRGAVQAWLCQLLQEEPGIFTPGDELWQERGYALVRDYPFQNGALTYSWVQVWPLLFRGGLASIYAPLSQARALPPYRAGLLSATRFPEPEDWNRYGLQADILWAKMYGDARQHKKLAATERWLKDPKIQTVIANTIEWIPAHPSGIPYNTVSWETQMTWLRSSFIWQGAGNAQDS
jgi:hypothetical protein